MHIGSVNIVLNTVFPKTFSVRMYYFVFVYSPVGYQHQYFGREIKPPLADLNPPDNTLVLI